jgi:hypothetical protein
MFGLYENTADKQVLKKEVVTEDINQVERE